MKVLNLILCHDGLCSQYVDMLCKCMPKDYVMTTAYGLKDFKEACQQEQPDIIHLHGCPQRDTLQLLYKLSQGDYRIVFSPHGQLHPWEREKGQAKALNLWLQHNARHFYVMVARSNIEATSLEELGWNQRIETVTNPIITRATTKERLAQQMTAIYQKVADSNPLEVMDKTTQDTLHILMKAGICKDQRWVSDATINEKDTDWRKLLIYAQHEGIAEIIANGIEIMQSTVPTIDASTIPVFLPSHYQPAIPMLNAPFAKLICTAENEASQQQLSLLRLCEIHYGLMRNDIDEELLLKELDESHSLPFFESLLTVLKQLTLLDEGYMPCTPAENKLTQQLRTNISKHLKI